MKTKLFLCLALIMGGNLTGGFHTMAAPSTAVQKVVAGNNCFAVELYGRLRAADGNVFFSPYSISTALAMTYAGAQGETATQMAQTLHFELPPEELHPAFAAMASSLEAIQKEGQVQLSVANSLWLQKDFSFLPDYLRLCRKDYQAEVSTVDFDEHAEDACKTINQWVADKTSGKIINLLKPAVVARQRLVLVDAIYFKGEWVNPFEANDTQDQPFHVAPGNDVSAPLMAQMAEFGYTEFPDLQVLAMPYEGNELSMVVLLPRKMDGLGNLEAQLTADNLATWTGQLASQQVQVFFPKFTATSQFSLGDTLAQMGMTDAFDEMKADFSGMNGVKQDLYITSVVHKAYVKVDEEGTEAAAATVVALSDKADELPPLVPVFRADHPFIFLIRDNRTGSILFLGRMTDPTK